MANGTVFYRSWILDPKATLNGLVFYYVISTNCLTILLTVLLFYSKLQYGVLLPSDPDSPHVLQDEAVVRLVDPQEQSLDLGKLRRLACGTLVIALMLASGNILHSYYSLYRDKLFWESWYGDIIVKKNYGS